jgi:hypothetical protein
MEVALYFMMLFLAFLVLTIMEIFKEQNAGN